MSAKEQIRQKLDELMGTGWDGAKNAMHYSHPRVCRSFLLGLCPHDALSNTKMSMGACPKIHDYCLKADYENSSKTCRSSQHHLYELTVLTYLQKVIRSCESINQAKKGRLARCKSNSWKVRVVDKEAELKSYDDMVDKKLIEAEELGCQGKVQEALGVIKEVERLKRRRIRLEKYLIRKANEPAKVQKHKICEECKLCIGIDDNEQRVANHSSGRLHKAMLAIRMMIVDLASRLEGVQESGGRPGHDTTQQKARPVTRLDLASSRAYSHSPRTASRKRRSRRQRHRRSYRSDSSSSDCSSRSRYNSRYKRHPRSRSRSPYRRSRTRSSSGSSYSRGSSSSRLRSRSTSRYSRSYSRGRSYSTSHSRSSSRSRSRSWTRSGSRRRSRSSSHSSRSRSCSRSYSTRRHRHRRERSYRSRSTCSSNTTSRDSENEDNRGELHSSQGLECESIKGEQAFETEAHVLTKRELAHSAMSDRLAAVDTAARPHESEVSTFLGSAPTPEEQSL